MPTEIEVIEWKFIIANQQWLIPSKIFNMVNKEINEIKKKQEYIDEQIEWIRYLYDQYTILWEWCEAVYDN